jgi:ribosomal small subunit protein bTHX
MGRGDKRTAKGKRAIGSHGNTRPAGKKVVKAAASAKAKKTAKKG